MVIVDGGPLIATLLLLLLLASPVEGCGPGRGSGRRRRPRKLTPLVFKQHVPNVSEYTLGASGLAEAPIKRGDAKFKDLVRNNNPDIVFKDEEGTGADRIMSQRCKDKLNSLAISVLNQWPGVKLRVTEAWDEDGMHAESSLHYEGRAVDITTSDRDRSKYGMLARLAVEAGFDWVYYESRGHIHCSVKSDSSIAITFGGCFPPNSVVIAQPGRQKAMSQIQIGDSVLSICQDGGFCYSDVIAFLDRDQEKVLKYYKLTTQSGNSITLTAKHLLYATNLNSKLVSGSNYEHHLLLQFLRLPQLIFAEDVRIGHFIFLAKKGVYAPLTFEGTIVVDKVATSCYAFVDHHLSHAVFTPLRGYHVIKTLFRDWLGYFVQYVDWLGTVSCFHDRKNETIFEQSEQGVHWYAKLMYKFAVNICGMNIYISL
ncbi:unnamed protein product [Candidula unifasciata]|uniref:Hedgehog protein n=1 Tax=Candidula unifasciata TaxID=100452 RepID=A0A8S3YLM4_9EUPU|nr:unnamed protein product [Candidula unifasciata]